MANFRAAPAETARLGEKPRGRFGQQILNLLDLAGARAAERRGLRALDRRELDDCGLTPADVGFGGFDLYAQDFRVLSVAERRAA